MLRRSWRTCELICLKWTQKLCVRTWCAPTLIKWDKRYYHCLFIHVREYARALVEQNRTELFFQWKCVWQLNYHNLTFGDVLLNIRNQAIYWSGSSTGPSFTLWLPLSSSCFTMCTLEEHACSHNAISNMVDKEECTNTKCHFWKEFFKMQTLKDEYLR